MGGFILSALTITITTPQTCAFCFSHIEAKNYFSIYKKHVKNIIFQWSCTFLVTAWWGEIVLTDLFFLFFIFSLPPLYSILLITNQAIFRSITIKHLASMAAGTLSQVVSMIDNWDSTWILNLWGTYGTGNINRYTTPVIGLKSRQLTALNVNQLHVPYSHFFRPVDACEVRRSPPLPSPHLSSPLAQSPGTGWRKNKLHAPFAFNYGSCLNLPTLK